VDNLTFATPGEVPPVPEGQPWALLGAALVGVVLYRRRRVSGLIAAICVAFSPALKAAVTVETFTDYQAFLNLLGPTAQVVNFDDVPTTPLPYDPSHGYAYLLDPNRYAGQGIVIAGEDGEPTVLSGYGAVSPPNVYTQTFDPGANEAPAGFRDASEVGFTHDGQLTPTSAFGTFFLGTYAIDAAGTPGQVLQAHGSFGEYDAQPRVGGTVFLGLATFDSVTGRLVPAISYVDITAGIGHGPAFLDNFTFATPGEVPPVPEANGWALLGAALAGVGLCRRRAAAAQA
jgi:hypothetical protein